ncbi:putative MnhB-related membrane protein [Saonia flava]|uniref:Putative MnhB-related membrane protein n=1 Tax=Saonia flava TaxID=523696 RepID=A0A846QX06_9FLAO|nr:DoxX family protein [Saonia flava]NJB70145.1 putative MnhB-related membrane protein [Saonia flava]
MKTSRKVSKGTLWISYILQSLIAIMLLVGAFNNLLQTDMAVSGAIEMGYPKASVIYLGIVLLISTVLYAIPQTTFLGCLLLTAWLGGAIATHIIHNDPIINILFPIVFGILVWLSIWLRNEKLRSIAKPRKKNDKE